MPTGCGQRSQRGVPRLVLGKPPQKANPHDDFDDSDSDYSDNYSGDSEEEDDNL